METPRASSPMTLQELPVAPAPPPATTGYNKAVRQRRLFAAAIFVLLVAAFVLNLVALCTASWIKTEAYYPTKLPVSFLTEDATSLSSIPKEQLANEPVAYFTGMRAGATHVCYTMADTTVEPRRETERCYAYRSDGDFLYLEGSVPNVYVNLFQLSMCLVNANYGDLFERFGMTRYSTIPELLSRVCRSQGYLLMLLPIGALVAIAVGVYAWFGLLNVRRANLTHMKIVTLSSCVAALLALATCVLWVGGFRTFEQSSAAMSLGASAYYTIASIVLLVVAAVAAKLCARATAASAADGTLAEPFV